MNFNQLFKTWDLSELPDVLFLKLSSSNLKTTTPSKLLNIILVQLIHQKNFPIPKKHNDLQYCKSGEETIINYICKNTSESLIDNIQINYYFKNNYPEKVYLINSKDLLNNFKDHPVNNIKNFKNFHEKIFHLLNIIKQKKMNDLFNFFIEDKSNMETKIHTDYCPKLDILKINFNLHIHNCFLNNLDEKSKNHFKNFEKELEKFRGNLD